ncbi:VOC family protein [Lentibacillus persicus]|uniref:VOC family protein n=1 Tax=Lentibacillus persicus TaxID=640948 RepID=UPI002481DFD0|nr:VOC family protein [Lentibacillus persicus]
MYYGVSNMEETKDFYQDVLGLSLQFADRDQWAQFKVNGLTFALGGPKEVPEELKGGAVVTFEVENLNKSIKELQNKGVNISRVRDMGSHGSTCYFRDPSNNLVQLYQSSK